MRVHYRKDETNSNKAEGVLMKKYFIVIIAVLFSFLSANMLFAAPNTWTQKADCGGAERIYPVGFSIGGKGYLGTGWDGSAYQRDFWGTVSGPNREGFEGNQDGLGGFRVKPQ